MADLSRKLNKVLLLEVAEEFDTNLPPKCMINDIRNAILRASDFEVELLKISIKRIMSEAEERKKNTEQEAEQERLDKLAEKGRLDKLAEQGRLEKLAEQERLDKIAERESLERLERQAEREFELEKLRLRNASEIASLNSNVSIVEPREKRVNLKDLVPRFEPKNIDISLLFMLVEKHVLKENVHENN